MGQAIDYALGQWPALSIERGAILYSIVESCRRRGLDPYRYLSEVLTALPTLTKWQVKRLDARGMGKGTTPRAQGRLTS